MNRVCKIRYWIQIVAVLFISVLADRQTVAAQSKVGNKYGLMVINNTKVLQKEIEADSNKRMVNILKLIPGLTLDLKYATTDNFMHQKLYPPTSTTFLRKPAAEALKLVVEELKKIVDRAIQNKKK